MRPRWTHKPSFGTYGHAKHEGKIAPWILYTCEKNSSWARRLRLSPKALHFKLFCYSSWEGKVRDSNPLSIYCPHWPSVQVNVISPDNLQDKRTCWYSISQMIKVSPPSTFNPLKHLLPCPWEQVQRQISLSATSPFPSWPSGTGVKRYNLELSLWTVKPAVILNAPGLKLLIITRSLILEGDTSSRFYIQDMN